MGGNRCENGFQSGFPLLGVMICDELSRTLFGDGAGDQSLVSASRRPVMGACRVRGDRGVFDRAGRRLAEIVHRRGV